jgi:hypothetical protein
MLVQKKALERSITVTVKGRTDINKWRNQPPKRGENKGTEDPHLFRRVESGGAAADDADVERLARRSDGGGRGEAHRPQEQHQPPRVGEKNPTTHLRSTKVVGDCRLPLGFVGSGEGKGRRRAAGGGELEGSGREEDWWPELACWRRPEGGVTGDGEEMLVSSSLVRSSERKSSREAGPTLYRKWAFPKKILNAIGPN